MVEISSGRMGWLMADSAAALIPVLSHPAGITAEHVVLCVLPLTDPSVPPPLRSVPPAALEACVGGGTGTGEASLVVAKRLHELLATAAMQFGGYIFRLSESQVRSLKRMAA